MARFSDETWWERNWQVAAWFVAVIAAVFFGPKLSEPAARAIDPFYAPAIMGFISGLVLIVFRRLTWAETESSSDDEAKRGYVENQWLKSPLFDLACLFAWVWFMAIWVYPLALDKAINQHITTDAYFLGLYLSLSVHWIIDLNRKFSLKRASK